MLELRLIGELAVVRGGKTQTLPASKKTRALLAYLAATARPQLREKLCELLWDGPDDPRAGLRWSLTKLRPIVDDRATTRLVADREHVELVGSGALIDVLAVRRAVPGGVPAGVARASTEALLELAPLLRGELLEGLELPDCFRFDDWLRTEREAARRLHVAMLGALVDRLRPTAPADALEHARAWTRLVPLDEAVHLAVMQLLVELDRKTEALAHYKRCARLFERELGHGPSRELERLRMAIGTVQAARPAAVDPLPEPVPAPATKAPLVGRLQERAALARLLEPTPPRARVTLVLGNPGIGKTSLLDELEATARARGMTALRGRGVEAELVRPYGAWLDAFAGRASAGQDPFRAAGDQDADRTRLFEAITAWLVERASAGLVVIIDDLQWLDEASAALLHFIARSPAAIRLALGARPGELVDNLGALRLVRGLTREHNVHQIDLAPLSAAETAELAAAHAPGVDAARVVAESGGHPLFAVEIARALARGVCTRTSLSELLAERLDLIDGTAREIVPWAAALGGAFSAEILAAVTGFPLADLGRAVGELERRALVHVVGSDWNFAHDLIRAAAYQRISAPHRSLLHAQIARALAALPDPDHLRAGDIAHHAGLGGDSTLCARASLAAAQRCLRLFAPEEATVLADRGLAHVIKLTGEDRVQLHIELLIAAGLADVHRRRRPALARELERAILDARAMGCHAVAARGFNEMSRLTYELGDYAGAASSSLAAATTAAAATPDVQARAFAYSAQCLAMLGRNLPQAEVLAGKAAQLATPVADIAELAFALALIRHHQGDDAAAITMLDRAVEITRRTGQYWLMGYGLSRGALFELQRGRPAAALPYCEAVRTERHLFGDAAEVPLAAVIEAAAKRALGADGDHGAAIESALVDLRAADAPAQLAVALTCLAELDLVAGRLDAAAAHAMEAEAVAARSEAPSELVVARTILVRIASLTGATPLALDAIDPNLLDARARSALTAALSAIDN